MNTMNLKASPLSNSCPCRTDYLAYHESGYCNDCYYYSTWNGEGWCDKGHHKIEDDNCEKGCYVSKW